MGGEIDFKSLQSKWDEHLAMDFALSKGRMPRDARELTEWLLEFSAHVRGMLNDMCRLEIERLSTQCTQTVIIDKEVLPLKF